MFAKEQEEWKIVGNPTQYNVMKLFASIPTQEHTSKKCFIFIYSELLQSF